MTVSGIIGNQTISVEANAAECRLFLLDGNNSPVVEELEKQVKVQDGLIQLSALTVQHRASRKARAGVRL